MKYDLSASHVMTPSVEAFDPLSLVEAQNEIITAYESLDESVRELVEVQSLMDNVQSSLSLLAKYGDSAIPQLNLDKGLEELLQIPEKMITAQKATSALEDADQGLFSKFIEGIKNFFRKIIAWVKTVTGHGLGWNSDKLEDLKRIIDSIDSVSNHLVRFSISTPFGGALTKKGFVEIPNKLVQFFEVVSKTNSDIEMIAKAFKDNVERMAQDTTYDGLKQCMDRLEKSKDDLYQKTIGIFGKHGDDANPDSIISVKIRNWIMHTNDGWLHTDIAGMEKNGVSLATLGFNSKSDFQDAYKGFEILDQNFFKRDAAKLLDDMQKTANTILSIRHDISKSTGADAGSTVIRSHLNRFLKSLYTVQLTAGSWLGDAQATANQMYQNMSVYLKGAGSASSGVAD